MVFWFYHYLVLFSLQVPEKSSVLELTTSKLWTLFRFFCALWSGVNNFCNVLLLNPIGEFDLSIYNVSLFIKAYQAA